MVAVEAGAEEVEAGVMVAAVVVDEAGVEVGEEGPDRRARVLEESFNLAGNLGIGTIGTIGKSLAYDTVSARSSVQSLQILQAALDHTGFSS